MSKQFQEKIVANGGVQIPSAAAALGKLAVSDASGNVSWQSANEAGIYTEAQVDTALAAKVGTGDSRLSDARTPTAHHASHAYNGSDALHPSDLGEWLDLNRHTDALATALPWIVAQTSITLTSGTIYGILTRVRTAGNATKMRVQGTALGSGVSDVKVSVYDPVGAAFLATSANLSGSWVATQADYALGSTLALTEGELLVLLIACVASTTGIGVAGVSARNSTWTARTTAMGYRKSWAVSGYTGTMLTPTGSSSVLPELELIP